MPKAQDKLFHGRSSNQAGYMPSSTKTNGQVNSRYVGSLNELAGEMPRKWQWRFFTLSLVFIDILTLGFAFLLAFIVRFNFNISIFQLDAFRSVEYYQSLSILLIPIWLVLFAFLGLYNRRNLLGGTIEYSKILYAATTGIVIVIFITFIFPEFILARGWVLLSWAFSSVCVTISRFTFRRFIYQLRKYGFFLSPAIILGANNEGISLAVQLTNWKTSGLQLIGFVDKKLPVGTQIIEGLRILGTVDQLDHIIHEYDVEEVILASSSYTSRDRIVEIYSEFGVSNDVNIRMSSGLYEVITTGLTVKEFAFVPLVEINKVRLTGNDELLKLILDYCVCIPVMILGLPIFLLLMLAIRIDSPGPVIYRRRVLGMHGREFDAFKFRTMVTNGDEILTAHPELKSELDKSYKIKEDPRVTRIGKYLRKFSIDEFPQFINVLKREMSLVGPRMISPVEIDEYEKWHMNLLTVRPGITGYWQVNGRSDVPYEERVRMDMYYIRNWSIWFDLQLLFQTIPAVLRRRGAY